MGLDTYARQQSYDTTTEAPDSLFDGVLLMGGLVSGGGASFRGKAYAALIEEITGVSLYTSNIPVETVKEMAIKISKKSAELPDCTHEGRDWTCERCDITHLKRWFQVAADNDCIVHGWW
jgi:hypothetical protein